VGNGKIPFSTMPDQQAPTEEVREGRPTFVLCIRRPPTEELGIGPLSWCGEKLGTESTPTFFRSADHALQAAASRENFPCGKCVLAMIKRLAEVAY
jgi:hypothetical protein